MDAVWAVAPGLICIWAYESTFILGSQGRSIQGAVSIIRCGEPQRRNGSARTKSLLAYLVYSGYDISQTFFCADVNAQILADHPLNFSISPV